MSAGPSEASQPEKTNMRNAGSIIDLHSLLDRMLAEATVRGSYSETTLVFRVEDGIIQADSISGETKKKFRLPKKK